MSASQTLGGPSRSGRVIGPSLDKIIKNAAWRKHSSLVSACKSSLDKLESLSDSPNPDLASPLSGLSDADAESVLQPLVLALDSAYVKVVEPALDCAFKLFSLNLVRAEIERPDPTHADDRSASVVYRMVEAVCKSAGLGEDAIELGVLRVLLAAVRSPSVLIRGDCLVHIVRTCYNVYLGGLNGTNQICAKSVLAQIMVIVFARLEQDSVDLGVSIPRVSVADLLEFTDKNLNEGSSIQFCQNFINEVMDANGEADGVAEENKQLPNSPLSEPNGNAQVQGQASKNGDEKGELGPTSKIREDGFLLFKNLCKLSMKFSSQDQSDDQILLRGKVLSLELLKVVMENAGPLWRTDERQVIFCFDPIL
jgi:brefeldin A-inhibited guanine nucleotide-exchange protein